MKVERFSKCAYNELTDSKDQRSNRNADERSKISSENQKIANQLHYSRPYKNNNDQLNTDVLLSVRDLKLPAVQEDLYNLLGKTIAIKLRGLENRQCLKAEKIISDVLFEAEMSSLTTHSCNIHGYMQPYQATYPTLSSSPTFISSPSHSPSSCSPPGNPTHRYKSSAIALSPRILHPSTTTKPSSEVPVIPQQSSELPVQVELSIHEEPNKALI